MFKLALVVSVLSAIVFSVAYLYFLGLRIIRHTLNDKTGAVFTALLVGCGILTATVTLEAVLLIGAARDVAGALFYAAAALGIVVAALGTAGVAGMPNPIAVALAHRRTATWGLVVGNVVLVSVNALAFSSVIPSVL